MKFFLDSANLDELKAAARLGIIDGVTTNPSLIAREGVPIELQIPKICELIEGDVSAEVVSTDSDEMVEEGRKLTVLHPSVVVKVPLTRDGIRACSLMSREGIRVNVTLCFSAAQALLAAKAGAYFVSPFVGRLEDVGASGINLIHDIVRIYRNFGYNTQVLAASLRNPTHVVEAAKAGAHIGTLPFKVLDSLFHHPLTDKGLEQFLKDHARVFEPASTKAASR